MTRLLVFLLFVACFASLPICASEVSIKVHVDEPQAELSPVLYGLFYEDINYAADGGLYAELVQNRSFEYYGVDGWDRRSRRLHPLTAWKRIQEGDSKVDWEVVDDEPLNEKNTKYLSLEIEGAGETNGIANDGFAGIPVKKGEEYDFSVYAKSSSDFDAPLTVSLEGADGKVLASAELPSPTGEWKKFEAKLVADASGSKAKLKLTTTGTGKLMLDMVSLFPRKTFKGRKNGLRSDLAQALAELEPGFLRFPGGCIAHGHGLDNAYRWKDTIGDVAERKPNWNLWGYHQTYGLGYFEFMQLCEDIGATPLPVVPIGVACGFRRPFNKVPMDEMQPWVDDALDLIEFANGPADSEWGAIRAKMGHPKPFGLEYVCLGNEEHDTPEARERFPLFVDAIREKYPEIKIIGTSGLGPEIPLYDLMEETKVYSSDEHYYMPPSWYLQNVDRFDEFDRSKPKIFVGEYASEGNTLFNAIAEAAYLTGVERNADIVDMTCYAPLFAKEDFTQWTKADMIWFNNTELMKTPNYYVQQMFSANKGDVYLKNEVEMNHDDAPRTMYEGQVGIGTWGTTIEVEKATLNGQPLDLSKWETQRGEFEVNDKGLLLQTDLRAQPAMSTAPAEASGDEITYEVRARKTGGAEGFLVVFGYQDRDDYVWWNVGGWGNSAHAIQQSMEQRSAERLISTPGQIESDRWYDLKVVLSPSRIRCYLDGQLVHDYQEHYPDVCVSTTLDKSKSELILKIVNPAEVSVDANIDLQGAQQIASKAKRILLSGPASGVNTISEESIAPVTSSIAAGEKLEVELPPTSVQVIRVSVQ